MVYYNEWDGFCAQWLRNLIDAGDLPAGDVDERSIEDVSGDDLRGYRQVHLFAGIGGWGLAARLSGWPTSRELWTGSCPCQRFSSAARGRHTAWDGWPAMRRLLTECRPATVVGEQVTGARGWVQGVRGDLVELGYECAGVVLPAYSLGYNHTRARVYFAGYADRHGEPGRTVDAETLRVSQSRGLTGGLAGADGVPRRVAQLRAYGNAIIPALGAEVLGAILACRP